MFDNITSFEAIRAERDTPRKQNEIHADISAICNQSDYPTLWKLIDELENIAWEAGAEEAIAWQEAFQQDPHAN